MRQNPLADFSLMDMYDLKFKVEKEKACRQALEIISKFEGFYKDLKNNETDRGWMPLTPFNYDDHIYYENVKDLVTNGFKVWKCKFVMPSGNLLTKHYISWTIDSFDNVFYELVTSLDANLEKSKFEETH